MPAMEVTRTPDGYQPPLNPNWTHLDQLRWVAATTGLNIDIAPSGRGAYRWHADGIEGGYHTFDSMWTFLVGVGIGAQLTQGAVADAWDEGREAEFNAGGRRSTPANPYRHPSTRSHR